MWLLLTLFRCTELIMILVIVNMFFISVFFFFITFISLACYVMSILVIVLKRMFFITVERWTRFISSFATISFFLILHQFIAVHLLLNEDHLFIFLELALWEENLIMLFRNVEKSLLLFIQVILILFILLFHFVRFFLFNLSLNLFEKFQI